jgi:hypothetical protein
MSMMEFKELTSLFLLIPLAVVVGVGMLFVSMAARRGQRKSERRAEEDLAQSLALAEPRYRPALFDQPRRWLAIKGSNPLSVQQALGLHHPTQVSWEEGLGEAREEDKLFISPPVGGWILVMGQGLPDPGEDVDQCFHFIVTISRKLGQVQFYNANRALNHHAWVLAERGRILRAYAWAGDTVWNQGQITAAERDLKMACFDYGTDRGDFVLKDSLFMNAEKVIRLAAIWSIDPTAIDDTALKAFGIAGEPSPIKPN